MKNIFYILITTILLTGCLSAKISHKSEVKANVTDNTQKQAEAKVDEQKETHIHEARIDTVIQIKEVQGAERVQLITDPNCFTNHVPISKTIAFGKGFIKAVFSPKTGFLDISAQIPPDTIRIQADVKETTISEHKTSDIDSSSVKKSNTKTDVKGSTSVSVSILQMPYLWAFGGFVAGLILMEIIKRKSKTA